MTPNWLPSGGGTISSVGEVLMAMVMVAVAVVVVVVVVGILYYTSCSTVTSRMSAALRRAVNAYGPFGCRFHQLWVDVIKSVWPCQRLRRNLYRSHSSPSV